MDRRQELKETTSYKSIVTISKVMDNYFFDPIIGFLAPGIGDVIMSAFALPFIYFSLVHLRSVPLTLAVLSNILKDVLFGSIPFCIGDIIDVFNRCYAQNLRLIMGYIDDDKEIIGEVNRKAFWSAIFIIILCVLIYFVVKWAVELGQWLFSLF
jgi:hypothetical protein